MRRTAREGTPWKMSSAPFSLEDLLARAEALAGEDLAGVAARAGAQVPANLRRHKGFVGSLVERALGARGGSRAEPDFPELGVELKTLPVDSRGRPLESTFVCSIALDRMQEVSWEDSWVRRKLARVLFVPVLGERQVPVAARVLGRAFLWSPDDEEEAVLRNDWEELAQRIARGDTEAVHGRLGVALQVRPKARDSRARRRAVDSEGVPYGALPRGFYLRATFTRRVLERRFALPPWR